MADSLEGFQATTSTDDTNAQLYNLQLANRQIQINEWTYNNRMETLFVFQVLFISLMITAILLYLRGAGLIGTAFTGYCILLLLLVFILIIVNRATYTDKTRDRRHWNKRNFADDNKLESPLGRTDMTYQAHIDAVRAKYGGSESLNAACKASMNGKKS